jgi:hypothetical protein
MIKCADRQDRLVFAFDECIDPQYQPRAGDEVLNSFRQHWWHSATFEFI